VDGVSTYKIKICTLNFNGLSADSLSDFTIDPDTAFDLIEAKTSAVISLDSSSLSFDKDTQSLSLEVSEAVLGKGFYVGSFSLILSSPTAFSEIGSFFTGFYVENNPSCSLS